MRLTIALILIAGSGFAGPIQNYNPKAAAEREQSVALTNAVGYTATAALIEQANAAKNFDQLKIVVLAMLKAQDATEKSEKLAKEKADSNAKKAVAAVAEPAPKGKALPK